MFPVNAVDAETDNRLWEIIDPGPARPLASVDCYVENSGKNRKDARWWRLRCDLQQQMHVSETRLAHENYKCMSVNI